MLGQEIPLSISNLRIDYLEQLVNNLVKSSDKDNYVSSGYGITFDSAGSWSLLEML